MSEPEDKEATEAGEQADAAGAAKEDLRAELALLKDQLLRALAEADNLRKRSERAVQEAALYGTAKFARELLSVADNLARALAAVPEEARTNDEAVKNLIAGIEAIERELKTVFERHGIRVINPKGERFDPHVHQAIAEVPGEPAGSVVSVAQTGYMLGERLLRPAMVTVARAAKGNDGAPQGGVDQTA